jgi:carboxypeptidase family protein
VKGLLLSFVLALPLIDQPQPRDLPSTRPAGSSVLAGRIVVVQGSRALPVRRARVMLESDSLSQPLAADSDTEGRYRFDGLAAGTYRLTADKAGFVMAGDGASRSAGRPLSITLGDRLSLDVLMVRGAAIEGRLVTETGEPAVNVVVSAFQFVYGPLGRRPTVVRQVQTDDLGRFRIHSLASGEYFVDAALDSVAVVTGPELPGERLPKLARTYYPGSPRVEEARAVTLAVGQEVLGCDFSVTSVAMSSVTVRPVDSTGKAAPNIAVRFQSVSGMAPPVVGFLQPDSNTARFPAVPPGDYWLAVATASSPTADPEFGLLRLTVEGQDLPDVGVTTARGAIINGRVDVEGSAALLPSGLQVVAHEVVYEVPTLAGRVGGSVPVGSDGTFSYPSLFGPRIMRLNRLPDGWLLKAVMLDDVDVADDPTDFRGGDRPRTMRFIVTPNAASLSGTVVDMRGAPSRARVVVFSDNEQRWGAKSRYIRTADAGADGRFSMKGLLPGKYLIVATSELEEFAAGDPDVLRRLLPLAAAFQVSEQGKAIVALTRRQ